MTEAAPRSLDVPPVPVGGPRGGGRLGFLVLAAVVAVVAGAIGIAQLAPAPAAPARISFAVPTLEPSVRVAGLADGPSPVPDPSALLAGTSPRLSRDTLAAAVRDGSLDGRLVFVDGVLDATPVRCQRLGQGSGGCVDLAIPGLGLSVRQGDGTIPWRAGPPPGAWLVTVARAGGLVYLGSLVPRPDGLRMPVAAVATDSMPDSEGTLFEADGFLVLNPVHPCFRPDAAATPCPTTPPFLARDEPLAEGTLVSDAGAVVSLAPSAPEVDPATVVTPGTFLVQRWPGGAGGVQVVARYVPSRAVRVLVP